MNDNTDSQEDLQAQLKELKEEFSQTPSMDNLYQIAITYHALGQTERGIGFAEAFLMQIENEKERIIQTTMILSMLERDEEATQALREAEDKFSDDPQIKRYEGMLLNKQKRFEEAVDVFDGLLQDNSDDLESISGKVIALLGLDRNDQAVKTYQASIKVTPKEAPQWHFKGMLDGLMQEYVSKSEGPGEEQKKKMLESFKSMDSLIDNFGPEVGNFYRMGQLAGREAYGLMLEEEEHTEE
ncbi:MAG: O-linked N-acetylglucosamine transferase [Methanolobus sp. T82-4]|jgi:tetratricopeptide (TPR) repeat protein|nr:MAG: O-linked N-acetylglucosamine transferase [Methanolobus sp. T82-4]